MIKDDEFTKILDASWDQLCFVAYDGFTEHGRGLVAINKFQDGELKILFTHPAEGHIRDSQVLNLINIYDPESEIIVQYPSMNGLAKTVRIEVDEKNPPAKIWKAFK